MGEMVRNFQMANRNGSVLKGGMENWTSGYSQSQLDEAQHRYDLRFPPDLVELFLERRPAGGYAWHTEDPRIRYKLKWPYEMLLFDIENGFWWRAWGERPSSPDERAEVLKSALGEASRLIPLFSHRFVPESPHERGNPVFSMHGFDTIYYGADLADYFDNEFRPGRSSSPEHNFRHIAFWSDIVEDFDVAYSYYEAANPDEFCN